MKYLQIEKSLVNQPFYLHLLIYEKKKIDAIPCESQSLHKTCSRLRASRFARCRLVLFPTTLAQGHGGPSAMPTAAQAASAPLMPFSPFVPRSVTRRGMGKFLLIYGAKRCRKYVSFQGLDLSKIATIVESASKSPINGAIFSEDFLQVQA